MDVRLPDGTVIRNVPDGTTKADLVAKLQRNGMSVPQEWMAPQKPVQQESWSDAPNAVGTGFWRGATRLLGLPVDTATNVLELGKAAIGAPYTAITGKPAPEFLQPIEDRSNIIGSGDNLLRAVRAAGGSSMVDPQNQSYEGGYLQNAGAALTGVGRPSSISGLANRLVTGQVSAAAGKAAYDASGDPALAVLASMAAPVGQAGVVEATKRAVRGNEAGRVQMAQRVQDLKNAGIDNPTLGLATGNATIGGIENLLQSTPGAVGVMQRSRDAALAGLENSVGRAASLAGGSRLGSIEAGSLIQKGGQQFKEGFKAQQNKLYDRLDSFIGKDQPVKVTNTRETLANLNADIQGAPELSKQFKNERIGAIETAILKDSGVLPTGPSQAIQELIFGKGAQPVGLDLMGRPVYRGAQTGVSVQPGATVMRDVPPPMRQDMMGNLVPVTGTQGSQVAMKIPSERVPQYASVPMTRNSFNQEVAAAPVIGQRTTVIDPSNRGAFSGVGVPADAANTLPFEAVKKTRTLVGSEIADNSLMSNVPRSKWNPLYGALSQDLQDAAVAAGPGAEQAMNRANAFTRSGLARMERIAPVIDRPSPEKSFQALESTLKDNTSTFQAVKKSLPEDARGSFAGTIIERLGKATPGQQDATGNKWSPETFLTNWNRISQSGKRELLSGIPNAKEVSSLVDNVAKSTAMMRDSSKLWANPSGTGANSAARGVFYALGGGGAGALAGLVNPAVPLGIGTGLLGVRGLAGAVTSPTVRNSMLRQTEISPGLLGSSMIPLYSGGLLGQYPEQQQ